MASIVETYDRHKHGKGCLVHQEALNMEAWTSQEAKIMYIKTLIRHDFHFRNI